MTLNIVKISRDISTGACYKQWNIALVYFCFRFTGTAICGPFEMPSLLKARDNILAADGVKPDVENAVQWMSLTMMKLKQILISTEDSSKQLNLQLLNVFEKSMKALKQKSLNNIQKSAHHCQPVIFDMLHSDVCDREGGERTTRSSKSRKLVLPSKSLLMKLLQRKKPLMMMTKLKPASLFSTCLINLP